VRRANDFTGRVDALHGLEGLVKGDRNHFTSLQATHTPESSFDNQVSDWTSRREQAMLLGHAAGLDKMDAPA
jgi:hypothetical protein